MLALHGPRTTGHGGVLVLLLVVAMAAALLPASAVSAAVDAGAEADFVSRTNQERTQRGLPALRVCTELRSPARSHSRVMAGASHLHHNPNLGSDVDSWQRVAENVGRGRSVGSLHDALMNSPGHRANILDGRVTQLGIGVEVDSSGQIWVTQVFRQPRSGAACTSPGPASGNTDVLSSTPGGDTGLSGDFTGDGRDELARFDEATGEWTVRRSTTLGTVTERWGRFSTRTGWSAHVVGDFDGDGRDDIASFHPRSGNWVVSRSTGSGFSTSVWNSFSTGSGWHTHLAGDFDGDGRDDIASFHPRSGNWVVSRSTGSGFSSSVWTTFNSGAGWGTHLVGDFTGNGQDDLASFHERLGRWVVTRSTASGARSSVWARFKTRSGWNTHVAGDFNGNGQADVASFHEGLGRWVVTRATSSGIRSSVWAQFRTRSGWNTHLTGDFNGDGRDGLASFHSGSRNWVMTHARADTGVRSSVWATFSTANGWGEHLVGDITGNGRSDIASYATGSGNWIVSRSTGSSLSSAIF